MSRLIQLDRTFVFKADAAANGTFEGYASTFNNEDSSGDTIVKGAFAAGIKKLADNGQKLKMLWNHDRYEPIGVFTAAAEDDTGLYVKGQLALGVPRADSTLLLMRQGAIDSMSIGGYVVKETVDNATGKSQLLQIDLREVSPVTFPANTQARISTVKSIEGFGMLSELEAHLRDAGGFSVKEAKAIIAKARGFGEGSRDVAPEAAQLLKAAIRNLTTR
jgi:HK97 family phage prohead protease